MYYEERWIDGKFCWRTSPAGAWTAYTANELAHRYQAELQRAHDLQRALDVEREKVKAEQEQWEIQAREGGRLKDQLTQLQAQLAEIEQILCIESGKTTVDKVRDLHQSFKQVWNSYQSAVNELFDTQAQLRQVEGDAETYRKMHAVCTMNLALANNDLTTLRQLVEALPVVDVQEVSVWLSPDESGWLVSKRPAFPAGLYWAKFRTQDEADSFRALLAYRATLDAQDAGKGVGKA